MTLTKGDIDRLQTIFITRGEFNARMGRVEERLDRVEERMDRLEERFGKLESRVSTLELKIDLMTEKFDRMFMMQDQLVKMFELRREQDTIAAGLWRDHDQRIFGVEDRVSTLEKANLN